MKELPERERLRRERMGVRVVNFRSPERLRLERSRETTALVASQVTPGQ